MQYALSADIVIFLSGRQRPLSKQNTSISTSTSTSITSASASAAPRLGVGHLMTTGGILVIVGHQVGRPGNGHHATEDHVDLEDATSRNGLAPERLIGVQKPDALPLRCFSVNAEIARQTGTCLVPVPFLAPTLVRRQLKGGSTLDIRSAGADVATKPPDCEGLREGRRASKGLGLGAGGSAICDGVTSLPWFDITALFFFDFGFCFFWVVAQGWGARGGGAMQVEKAANSQIQL
ncbi:uncharacterized protein N7482_000901 [Penicillium canariense]|uniref:Uncharacterized protein n=1 Tax=Penicillium canariense TaxID=189055 RepID=A0A9W9LTD4_9EURO|nr:uncharacterized protein N7482_000901 [Penicillium canariense]KAJ5175024.1 hypothetical protein N7482_000901 [Penicillium canariense]